jgi:hypothetical protein
MYVFYNPNPQSKLVGDCVIRAICKLTDRGWEDVFLDVALQGFMLHDMPNANHVWGSYLKQIGYVQRLLPDSCPDCYTVKDFCRDFNKGKYLLSIGNHVVTVQDGDYYDTWDSGDEIPMSYWKKGDQ